MSSQDQESRNTEDRAPELELNKETLQDMDVEPTDVNEVKGGGITTQIATGRDGGGILAANLRTTRPTDLA